MLFLIIALDHPFRGDISLGADAFEQVLDSIVRAAGDERATVTTR